MNEIFQRVGKFFQRLLARFPTAVPMGVSDFNDWADSIINLYGFPNNDSVRFALATIIMHLGPTAAYKSKHYFAVTIKAAAAKQVAGQVFQDLKAKQQAKQEADKAAQTQPQAEVPAAPGASSDAK